MTESRKQKALKQLLDTARSELVKIEPVVKKEFDKGGYFHEKQNNLLNGIVLIKKQIK